MTKSQILADLSELLSDDSATDSPHHGEAIASFISRLQFHGAEVYEPRGIEDTGLTDETLLRALQFCIPSRLGCDICTYLDRQGGF